MREGTSWQHSKNQLAAGSRQLAESQEPLTSKQQAALCSIFEIGVCLLPICPLPTAL
jgi:hypothetical protein